MSESAFLQEEIIRVDTEPKIISLIYKEVYEHKAVIYKFLKRSFDILASCFALVVLSPIFMLTALAIILEDGGLSFLRRCAQAKT